jgi:hypothetical protein
MSTATVKDRRAFATAPERTLDQRRAALERANLIRTGRAQIKRDLKAGRVSITDLLTDPPACLLTAKVFEMLRHTPKYGRVKVNKCLAECLIAPAKTFGGLSDRQRDDIVSWLGQR